ncbi:helix-turn-helix domain-containing protein [Roseitalea sp. MMSF_3504]|uniref:sigma-54-dependent Fis family transcriptional regulator n=1 Tax=Roseitalea sp. MMSF_3504 TaxID=3046716 RepID=UPI0027401D37|nr:helix-turn-helix domain-containing protein [Roseitalea sp. MMSF_3504]
MRDALGDVRSEIDLLADVALKAGQCLVVTDPGSVVVEVRADPSAQSILERAGITLGSCWTEQVAGTNGVSLALAQGKAFTARGPDHYLRNLREFACTGVPLRAADGRVMGTLTLSCIDRDYAADYVLAQQLLNQASDGIQARLFLRAHSGRHVVAPSPEAPPGALVAIDDGATIVAATRAAEQMPGNGKTIIGRPFEEVFIKPLPAQRAPGRVASLGGVSGRLPHAVSQIAGQDLAANKAATRAVQILSLGQPLAIVGAAGTGKLQVAEGFLATRMKRVIRLCGSGLAAHGEAGRLIAKWIEQADEALNSGSGPSMLLDRIDCIPRKARHRLIAWLEALDRDGRLRGVHSETVIVATIQAEELPANLRPLFASHEICLPPLRDRSDKVELIQACWRRLASDGQELCADAVEPMLTYPWPGNFRELQAVLSQALTLAGTNSLERDMLPDHIRDAGAPRGPAAHSLTSALMAADWNVSRAARLMGVSRATINRRIREAGLSRPVVRDD